ncbi:MAG: coproporphyrinogen dehydrogenase HemZ [Clostridiales bacterium]|nr:coproporphyrinogen dehydrogenase HemZ [Clostridiales bacterium]
MIITDLENFQNDLNEVENLFEGASDLRIRHLFSQSENKVVNTIVVGGKSYAFGTLLGKNLSSIEEKRLLKRYAKLAVYKALSKFFDKTLPWGALTGIRPTKLAYQQLESEGEFKDFFVNTMKVTEQKTLLTQRVIDTQKGIYCKDDSNADFFVFIPFCPTRCKYCSFISSDMRTAEKYVDEYIDTLCYEIKESIPLVKNLRSIYIGGGTPVSLSDERLKRVLDALKPLGKPLEFTVEAGRPDRINKENLKILKDYDVTRICVNPQTFNDKTLKLIGRNHTAEQAVEKFHLAKEFGFDVNMDLIAGLDGESFEDFRYSLDRALSLQPEDITVHTLCIKRGSYLSESTERLSGETVAQMVDYAYETLTTADYSPYYLYRQKYMAGNLENVGYCKSGKACVYNVDVMEEISQNIACGASAITKRVYFGGERIERVASPKDVPTYIQKIETILEKKKKLFE